MSQVPWISSWATSEWPTMAAHISGVQPFLGRTAVFTKGSRWKINLYGVDLFIIWVFVKKNSSRFHAGVLFDFGVDEQIIKDKVDRTNYCLYCLQTYQTCLLHRLAASLLRTTVKARNGFSVLSLRGQESCSYHWCWPGSLGSNPCAQVSWHWSQWCLPNCNRHAFLIWNSSPNIRVILEVQ